MRTRSTRKEVIEIQKPVKEEKLVKSSEKVRFKY